MPTFFVVAKFKMNIIANSKAGRESYSEYPQQPKSTKTPLLSWTWKMARVSRPKVGLKHKLVSNLKCRIWNFFFSLNHRWLYFFFYWLYLTLIPLTPEFELLPQLSSGCLYSPPSQQIRFEHLNWRSPLIIMIANTDIMILIITDQSAFDDNLLWQNIPGEPGNSLSPPSPLKKTKLIASKYYFTLLENNLKVWRTPLMTLLDNSAKGT